MLLLTSNFLLLTSCLNDRSCFGFAVTDVIQKRDIGWAGVLARAAFDAVHDVVFLGFIEIIELGHLVEQEAIQDQADVDALKNLGMIYFKKNDAGLASMVTSCVQTRCQ